VKEWPELIIDDVCTVTDCLHKTAPSVDYVTPYKMLRTINIRDGRIIGDNIKYVTKETYDKWSVRGYLEKDDIILTREAPMGEVGIIKTDEKFFLGQRMLQLKANTSIISPDFLYYSLLAPGLQNQIKMHEGTGSVVSNIRIPELKKMKIKVPTLEVQQRITSILRSIDDKILLNIQMNQTVEEMAMTFFKHCFVDFGPFQDGELEKSEIGMIPKGWEVRVLSDLIEQTLGGDWGKSESIDDFTEEVLCVRGTDIPKLVIGESGDIPTRYIKKNSVTKRKLKQGDIVLEKSGGSPTQSTGRSVLINREMTNRFDKDLVYTNFCVRFTPKDLLYKHVIYQKISDLYYEGTFFTYENGTTGIKNLDIKSMLSKETVVLPNKENLLNFNEKLESFRSIIQENGIENEYLMSIRDYLLPRLLSGEIDLSAAKETVGNVVQ
jgi:type I restriction enzyme, S subunit